MSGARVVLAEDEALIRLDIKESLIQEGYDVVGEASDGAEAVELVRELKPDLALLDIMMPGVDGLTATREIMSEQLAAVVILTAYSQRDLVNQATEAGAMAYLVKPVRHDKLTPTLEVALARFRQFVEMTDKADSLEKRLDNRRAVDRAKGVLMDEYGYSEQGSYRYVQQMAMTRRTNMKVVSDEILEGTLIPPPASEGEPADES